MAVHLSKWRGQTNSNSARRCAQVRCVLYTPEKEILIDNSLVRIHFIVEMIWWTGLAPWKFELPFPGSLIYTFLVEEEKGLGPRPVVGEAVVEPLVEHVALWEPHFLELRVEGLGFNLLWG